MAKKNHYLPIKDYALIGDCHTAALISSKGSIDWYCPGRFDNPAVFCRILDSGKGGFFEITRDKDYSFSRKYLGDSNILTSIVTSDESKLLIKQFMPIRSPKPGAGAEDAKTPFRIISSVEGLEGNGEIRVRFNPTFNFARNRCEFGKEQGAIIASWSNHYLTLSSEKMEFSVGENGVAEGKRKIKQGEQCWIILDYSENKKDVQISFSNEECNAWFDETKHYWKEWSDRCTYNGPYRKEVLRSALTLKLLTYEPTGAIIGAPTTSLPEEIGGSRNWDYRYSWLRDSSLMLYALMTIGYHDQATDFLKWLQSTQKRNPTAIPQILYKIDGEADVHETIVDHLEGYRGSKPVRIGNAAAGQFQLDIFGEILTTAYLYLMHDYDRSARRVARQTDISHVHWPVLKALVNDAADKWKEPDNGIWEVRKSPQEFLYSRLMCWAALDRGIRLAKTFQLDASITEWERTREEIRTAILEKGYNKDVNAFTQSFGSNALDASALAISRIGFLPCTDPRVVSTIDQIQKKLSHHGLIYRYLTEDGLPGQEATFALCTFWQVDALALSGRKDEAHDLFEKIISYSNDVGLMSEELDPDTGEFLGNFPQGFSHLALIGSAVNLAKAAKHGSEKHAENEAQRSDRARDAAAEGHSHRPRQDQ